MPATQTPLPPNEHLFITALSPLIAPLKIGGDLRLAANSPVVDAGLNREATSPDDVMGNPRIVETVDLGAFKFQSPVYVKASVIGGTGDGSTWANAFPKLQDALSQTAKGRRIYVAAGTYYPDEEGTTDSDSRMASFSLNRQLLIRGGFPAEGNPTLAERDPKRFRTVLSGDIDQNDHSGGDDSGNSYHVVTALDTTPLDRLDGLTIEAVKADDANQVGDEGYAEASNFFAIFNAANDANSGRDGGGVFLISENTITLTDCLLQGNHSDTFGGAIASGYSATYLESCCFLGNTAAYGGAIFDRFGYSLLLNCHFQGNSSSEFGSVYYGYESDPRFFNCVFLSNHGRHTMLTGDGSCEYVNCTWQGNQAKGGNVILASGDQPFVNCLLWGNLGFNNQAVPSASLQKTSASTFTHSLIQYWNAAALGSGPNLDGTNQANDRRFLLPLASANAPLLTHGDTETRD